MFARPFVFSFLAIASGLCCDCRAASDDAAFGAAKWLWPRELGAVTNAVVEFRQRFVAGRAGVATLAIAADTVYDLRLNGREIHSGRFPDVPPQRYFDTFPVNGVRPGTNELTVALYVQGVDSFQTIPGDPGLMFSLKGDGVRAESGVGTEWRMATRHVSAGVPLVTGQLGFSFSYDATRPEDAWKAVCAGDAVRGPEAFALSPRPAARVETLSAVKETLVAQGLLDGSPVPALADVARGMDATAMTPVARESFFDADGHTVRPACFPDGFYVIVDLGREEAGFLSLDVETDEDVVIDVGHAEHWENGRIRTWIGRRNFAGRYRTKEGRQTFCRWERRMAGRYLQVHVRGVRTRFRLNRLTVRPAVLPVTELPPPAGLTPRQRQIWDTSVRTLRLCMHEHYEDCPWREQALYGNDARNQMLCGYYAFAPDHRLPELALSVHARGLDERAWLELCMPAKIRLTIPSFTFCWVLAVDDNLRFRKDPAFTRTLMPTVRRILDTRLSEVKDGLLPCPEGQRYWQFYEWAEDLEGDLSGVQAVKPGEGRLEAPLNLFFVLALEAGARCAAATGDDAAGARWRQTAETVRAAVRTRFWNAERVEVVTRLNADLKPAELTQALALLADAVPASSRAAVARKLMSPSEWTPVTLSQTLYKYEALIAVGGEAAASVVPAIEREWGAMLDAGATSFWEMREGWPAFSDAGSLCHGWSAVPVCIFGGHPELLSL